MRNILSYPSILPDEHTCFSILQAKNGTRRRKCGWIWTKTTFRPRTTTFHKAGNRPLTPIPANLTNSTSPFVSPSGTDRWSPCPLLARVRPPFPRGALLGAAPPRANDAERNCQRAELRVLQSLSASSQYVVQAARLCAGHRGLSCLVLSCLLTLYTAVMSFEILFPFGLWVSEPGWLLNHSQLV